MMGRRICRRGTVGAMVHVLVVVTAIHLAPAAALRFAHAQQPAQRVAAVDASLQVDALSQAFQEVAVALRPSVVSISSRRTIERQRRGMRPSIPNLPDELRRFFGDDLDQFFQFEMPESYVQRGLGSGVIVSEDGYILTNNHVVEDAEVQVILPDDRQFEATLVGADSATDLAVLKIDATGLTPAKLGDSEQLQVGQWVLAIGSPMGLPQTVTAGIISATGRANLNIAAYEDFIQTDAAINPGNSGGPLVNMRGEVVGINTAIASRTGGFMGIGFAIPSSMARLVMQEILEHGRVERGWLGVSIQNLDREMAATFNYSDFGSKPGVLVADVVPGSPAEKAGIVSGDIIVEYQGQPVANANALSNAVAATKPGTEVQIRIFREGEYQTIPVIVTMRDEEQTAIERSPTQRGETQLGMTVRTLTPELAANLGVEENVRGVVVTEVNPVGRAYDAGIRTGDVILKVGPTDVATTDDFREAIGAAEGPVRLQILRDGMKRFVVISTEE